MAKYIDADLLRKEIDNVEEEARKVRVSGTDKEAIGADGKVKLCLELKAIINSLQQGEPEKPIPNDLEEAAEEYKQGVIDTGEDYRDECGEPLCFMEALKPAFIAGAKWQADHAPLPEDTVLFNKGVEEGKRLMMEEAVECETVCVKDRLLAVLPMKEFRWTVGDKVRVIIVKED